MLGRVEVPSLKKSHVFSILASIFLGRRSILISDFYMFENKTHLCCPSPPEHNTFFVEKTKNECGKMRAGSGSHSLPRGTHC